MVPSIIWRAKNLIRWVYALRWVPVQTLDKWGCFLRTLHSCLHKLALYVLIIYWKHIKFGIRIGVSFLKISLWEPLEVEPDVGSLYGASAGLYVGLGASAGVAILLPIWSL